MKATSIFFVLYKLYIHIIFYQKHLFKFPLLKKNLNFCSENWLYLFSSLWVSPGKHFARQKVRIDAKKAFNLSHYFFSESIRSTRK